MEKKQRLEAFSDGVIAIIITIMVLNIKIPVSDELPELIEFMSSITVFFVSFMIVGTFWNNHRRFIEKIETINNKLIWRNLLFLFFLSLIPIFTNWVTKRPNVTMPIVGYGVVYLLVNVSYNFMFSSAIPLFHERVLKSIKPEKRSYFIIVNTIITPFLILFVILISFVAPRFSTIILIGFPLISSVLNLWFDHSGDRKN